jgi:4-amino-4-deoxy-L-arabinose transferase-like glycosyltransferase
MMHDAESTNIACPQEKNYSVLVFAVLLFLLFSRLLAMVEIPLNDKTEARYGEIARIMCESGNWVTPMQAVGDPFWAKPPLSTWSSALFMKVFGVHAWSARIPSLLFAMGVLALIGFLVLKRYARNEAYYVMLILAGSPYFFINAGVVMTDPSLIFSTTLCMVAGWFAISEKSKLWGYLFFAGLGIGLLAKGPLIGVLVIIPLFLWGVHQRAARLLWKSFPWVMGSLLTLTIALPWYLLAEIRTPGFLNYFIVGEHISRFLQSGWQGDKYGFAHAVPYGMVWVYLLGGLLPWLIIAVVDYLMNRKRKKNVKVTQSDGWVSYLLCFAMTPLIFFTVSRNIIYTYTFSSIPAFSLLLTEGIHRNLFPSLTLKRCAFFASIIGSIFLLVSAVFYLNPSVVAKSQNRVIDIWQQQKPRHGENLIYWASQIDYSAQFYSQGHVKAVRDISSLTQLLQQGVRPYVVVRASELNEIPLLIRQRWKQIEKIKVLKHVMILYRVP